MKDVPLCGDLIRQSVTACILPMGHRSLHRNREGVKWLRGDALTFVRQTFAIGVATGVVVALLGVAAALVLR